MLEVENLTKYYDARRGLFRNGKPVRAVDSVSFSIEPGETIGIVGESGCGKSTLGRTLLRLIEPTAGRVVFEGKDITKLKGPEMRAIRRNMQIVFQDPYASLNPRNTVRSILEYPFKIHNIGTKKEREERIERLIERVGLRKEHLDSYPHQFSGGQRQRLGIARALALNPKLVLADEPVSALDVSVQSQVLNLMKDLKKEFGLTYVFISHDLSVVKHISDKVAVMYLGRIVEMADKNTLYAQPKHPYTQSLLSAIPKPDPTQKSNRIILQGELPSPTDIPSGCPFHTRCPVAVERCKVDVPELQERPDGHRVACHLA